MVDRIATYAHSQSLAQELMRLQSAYSKGQMQASSGLKSSSYQGISTSTQRLLNLQSDYSRITGQSENAQIALDRVNSMYSAIQTMLDMMTAAKTLISESGSGTGYDSTALQNEATQARDEFASSLNIKQAGRYLFGGGVTDTAPVDVNASGYGGATSPSTENIAYYQGGGYQASVNASDSLSIKYGITADDPAFEMALRSYDLLITNPTDQTAMQEAYALFDDAFDAMNTLQTQLSNQATALDNQINRNADELNLLDGLIEDIQNVDLAEVTVRLSELETQLEASYALTTKLLTLNLHDYL